ncbi:hypothetical protein M0R45_034948 [Rubus argutus]|uniref:Uncharacterized protein n=1 Tax=Rubus argutus TaxID=59490 RepID=A0AAW1VVD1_RUBAR
MVSESVALDMIVKESVDLVLDHLKCTKDGLSSDEVKERLDSIVYSKLEEKKSFIVLLFYSYRGKQISKDFGVCMETFVLGHGICTYHSHCFYPRRGDQLAIGKDTGRRLWMGTKMYPASALLGDSKDADHASIPSDELIEKAVGLLASFPSRNTIF